MKGRAPNTASPTAGVGTHSVPNTKPSTPNVLHVAPVCSMVFHSRYPMATTATIDAKAASTR